MTDNPSVVVVGLVLWGFFIMLFNYFGHRAKVKRWPWIMGCVLLGLLNLGGSILLFVAFMIFLKIQKKEEFMKAGDLLKFGFVLIIGGILALLGKWIIVSTTVIPIGDWEALFAPPSLFEQMLLYGGILAIIAGGLCTIKAFFDKSKKEK